MTEQNKELMMLPDRQVERASAEPGTPVDDTDRQAPFRFTGKLSKLTPEDEKKLMETQRNNRASE
jgi:hypothetical protein